ncbi:hypothetical protein LTR08_002603 [Meristemomyces frigidus]|nr:hypothetical protein LTR08_002603 [Meristemomyces frigidus]
MRAEEVGQSPHTFIEYEVKQRDSDWETDGKGTNSHTTTHNTVVANNIEALFTISEVLQSKVGALETEMEQMRQVLAGCMMNIEGVKIMAEAEGLNTSPAYSTACDQIQQGVPVSVAMRDTSAARTFRHVQGIARAQDVRDWKGIGSTYDSHSTQGKCGAP